ncbi:MAG: type 1 glutamine amidotransferase domain-containing protein, partial [Rhodomicrobium sp.]
TMAQILVPIPARDFDPTEAAVSWQVLKSLGHMVIFATPDGKMAEADEMMLTGQGLDLWGFIPFLRRLPLLGLLMRADRIGRRAYEAMRNDSGFKAPIKWNDIDAEKFDGLLLPGGHRARGMRPYLESPVLQRVVAEFFEADKPVAAICHGVLLVARSISKTAGKSVLYGRKTTALTWAMESAAASVGRVIRFWDPCYYRTYREKAGQSRGYMSVQAEVTRALQKPEDFLDVPKGSDDYRKKTIGLNRDTLKDSSPAFVVQDGNYVSARWPGDVHTFAKTFARLVSPAHQKAEKAAARHA